MKVYIGPYKNHIKSSLYKWHMERKYGEYQHPTVQSTMDNFIKKLDKGIDWIYDQTINRVRSTERVQKIRIDSYDTWSLDHTVSLIMLPLLKQLKETNRGFGSVADKDVPPDLRNDHLKGQYGDGSPDNSDEYWELGAKKWDYVMDEMIFAFEMKIKDDWESDYYKFEYVDKDDPDYKNLLCGMKLLWKDEDGRKKTQERISNGFRLMGLHFENLWD